MTELAQESACSNISQRGPVMWSHLRDRQDHRVNGEQEGHGGEEGREGGDSKGGKGCGV
jgi:hypothetical protein